MSCLSRCSAPARTPKALPATTMFKVMVVFTAVLCFGLSHLYLRFSLNQVHEKTIGLQVQESALQSELNILRSQTEALRRSDKLLEYAQLELGLVRYSTVNRDSIAIPHDVYARYELARAGQTRPSEEARPQAPWLDKLGERVGLIGQALAREAN